MYNYLYLVHKKQKNFIVAWIYKAWERQPRRQGIVDVFVLCKNNGW